MKIWIIIITLGVLTGVGFWFGTPYFKAGNDTVLNRNDAASTGRSAAIDRLTVSTNPVAKRMGALHRAYDPVQRRTQVASISQSLAELPPEEATRLILGYLETGEDIAMGMDFTIGPDGFLISAPTARVFMLDQLARINPAEAARQAETLLVRSNHPDEWAVAMKYYAEANPTEEGAAFLRQKLRQMWSRRDWSSRPSTGYLEAFDVVVHLGGPELIPDLASMIRNKEMPSLGHAAYLALDRLVIRDPVSTLTLLGKSPELMRGHEATRANYFARADVRHPEQLALLEAYLLNPARSPEELDTFTSIFPNANYMISHNLLTTVRTPDGAERADLDRAALETVKLWRKDPRFGRMTPQLFRLQSRLVTFVPNE